MERQSELDAVHEQKEVLLQELKELENLADSQKISKSTSSGEMLVKMNKRNISSKKAEITKLNKQVK